MIKKKNVQNSKHDDVVAEIKKYAKKDTIQFTVVAAACDPVNPDRDEMAESSGEKIFNVQKIGTSYGFSLSTGPFSKFQQLMGYNDLAEQYHLARTNLKPLHS